MLLFIGICLIPRLAGAQNRQVSAPPAGGSLPARSETDQLPPQVLAIADFSAQMQVVQHCSRLLIMRTNVTRTFVADPRIVEVVQFRANEVALIGLDQGSTTVTLWFENATEPLIYRVQTVSPAARSKGSAMNKDELAEESSGTGQPIEITGQTTLPAVINRSPQVSERPAVPEGTRAIKRLSGAKPAAAAPPARYDGHSQWPATGRTATRTPAPAVSNGNRLSRLPGDG